MMARVASDTNYNAVLVQRGEGARVDLGAVGDSQISGSSKQCTFGETTVVFDFYI